MEILFEADGAGTLVRLEHRDIERFGARHAQMRAGIAGPNGWPSILGHFAELANGQ